MTEESRTTAVRVLCDLNSTAPDSDKKVYRLIRLVNGLRALLIHDPTTEDVKRGPDSMTASGYGSETSSIADDEGEQAGGDEDMDTGEEGSSDEESSGSDGAEDGEDSEKGGRKRGASPGGVKKAAAAMAVGVGSFSDPPHCQGLAHYCEHMLFMGSERHPDENEYDMFINKHGGSTNAYTECEHTGYHFDILPDKLDEALDRFSCFFKCPLMLQDSSDRELQSIESEFCLSRNSDSCRLQELWCHTSRPDHPYCKFSWGNLRSLREEPLAAGVDVRQELLDFHGRYYYAPMMQLTVLGTQSLDELQDMVVRHFSGIAAEPRKADGPVIGRVQTVPNTPTGSEAGDGFRPSELLSFEHCGAPIPPEQLGRLFRVQPVNDTHKLNVSWQLPPQLRLYKSKPTEYLSHLIGHEGGGSLLSLCKARAWATGVSAGVWSGGAENGTCCAVFCVTFSLTKAGVLNWPSIVSHLYAYLGMLEREGLQEWVFKEIQAIANIQYRFQEEPEVADLVGELAAQMLPASAYEEQDLLRGPYLYEEYRPDLIKDLLIVMTPANARYDLSSSTFGRASEEGQDKGPPTDNGDGPADGVEAGKPAAASDLPPDTVHLCVKPPIDCPPSEEPRFGVRFWSDPLPSRLLEQWGAALASGTKDSATSPLDGPKLALPQPNPFIPTDFELKPLPERPPEDFPGADGVSRPGGASAEGPPHSLATEVHTMDWDLPLPAKDPPAPEVVMESTEGSPAPVKLWHLQDRVFRTPRAEIYIKVVSPVANADPRSAALCELLVRLVNDSLTEYSYMAQVAELHYSISAKDYGFQVHVSGFHHKAPVLTEGVLRRLLDFGPHMSEHAFHMQREVLLRSYSNSGLKSGSLAKELRLQLLQANCWSADEKQAQLQGLAEGAGAPDLAELRAFLPKLLGSIQLEALVHGNLSRDDALSLGRQLEETLQSTAQARTPPGGADAFVYPEQRITRVGPGEHMVLCVPSKDPSEQNSAVQLYWQFGKNELSQRVLIDVIEQIMEEPLYNQLRTQEQLGYDVNCGVRSTAGVLGFCVTLSSAAHGPAHLVERAELFLVRFWTMLEELGADDLGTHIRSLAMNKLQRDHTLAEEASRHWPIISERRRDFNPHISEARALAAVTKEQVLERFQRWFGPASPDCRRMTVMVASAAKLHHTAELEALTSAPKRKTAESGPAGQDSDRPVGFGGALLPLRVLSGPSVLRQHCEQFKNLV